MAFKATATAAVVAAFLFAIQTASALPLTYTDASNPLVVKSNQGTIHVTEFTITNPNTFTVNITSIGNPVVATHNNAGKGAPGNPHDIVTSAVLYNDVLGSGNCYVGDLLLAGSSCTIELALEVAGVAPHGTGNNAATYGDNKISVLVTSNHGGSNPSVTAQFVTEVDYAPEPGSLVLLGTGMLGLAGLLRKKLGRH